jgi:hypothetical protein
MKQIPKDPNAHVDSGTETRQHRKAADYIYQAATVAAALLLLLTATV